jgi:hypothetical protein
MNEVAARSFVVTGQLPNIQSVQRPGEIEAVRFEGAGLFLSRRKTFVILEQNDNGHKN